MYLQAYVERTAVELLSHLYLYRKFNKAHTQYKSELQTERGNRDRNNRRIVKINIVSYRTLKNDIAATLVTK